MEFFFIVIVFGIFAIWHYFTPKEPKVKRKLRKVPRINICDVQEGEYVKITGTVSLAEDEIESPLSGRKCVAYYIRVAEKSRGSNGSGYSFIEEHKSIPFLLQDPTGTAWVKLQAASVHLESDRTYLSGISNDATDTLESFLKKHGESSKGMFGDSRSLRYDEGIIEAGEVVSILGYGTWLSSEMPTVTLANPSKKILVIQEGKQPVYVTDAEV